MSEFLPGIEHIVVVMLENRSLDNMLGTLFLNDAPSVFLPPGRFADFRWLAAWAFQPIECRLFHR